MATQLILYKNVVGYIGNFSLYMLSLSSRTMAHTMQALIFVGHVI